MSRAQPGEGGFADRGNREKGRERERIQQLKGKSWCPSGPWATKREIILGGDSFYSEAEMGLLSEQVKSHFCGHQISALI